MSIGRKPADSRPRILFVAEAVSLAHVTRPLVLAKSLDPQEWEVHFACGDGYAFCTDAAEFTKHRLGCVDPKVFLARLASGSALYTEAELRQYIEEDIGLLDTLAPDLVVGDFRLSLAVSARLRKTPYLALTNAHWSPYSVLTKFPFPEHPLGRFLGIPLATWLFHRFQPLVFASHARPMNRIRRRFGLPPISDLRQLYTDGDWTIYADTPTLVPTKGRPSHHIYIGPLLWSPEIAPPLWWHDLPSDRPTIYVTLGSTGAVNLLPELVSTLSTFNANILVATAGRLQLNRVPANVWAADYLPGTEAAARSSLVVCSGGSATAYQGLSQGKPILGVCSNMDQYLTMSFVEAAGAGMTLRAGRASAAAIRTAIEKGLRQPELAAAAEKIRVEFGEYNAPGRFVQVLRGACVQREHIAA